MSVYKVSTSTVGLIKINETLCEGGNFGVYLFGVMKSIDMTEASKVKTDDFNLKGYKKCRTDSILTEKFETKKFLNRVNCRTSFF